MWDQGRSIAMAVVLTKKRQNEISKETGIAEQRLSGYKSGHLKMSVPIAERLATAFGMKLSEFVKLGE